MSPEFTECVNPVRLVCSELSAGGCPNGAQGVRVDVEVMALFFLLTDKAVVPIKQALF